MYLYNDNETFSVSHLDQRIGALSGPCVSFSIHSSFLSTPWHLQHVLMSAWKLNEIRTKRDWNGLKLKYEPFKKNFGWNIFCETWCTRITIPFLFSATSICAGPTPLVASSTSRLPAGPHPSPPLGPLEDAAPGRLESETGSNARENHKSRCGGRGRSASAAEAGASRRPSARPPGTRGPLNPPKTAPSWPRYGFHAPCPSKSLLRTRNPRTLT